MNNAVLVLSFLLLVLRIALVAAVVLSGTVSGAVLGVSGSITIATTIAAWSAGRPDLSWSGLGVGVGHLAVMLFVPGQVHLQWVGPIFWALFVVQCWVRWCLGRRCTVTGPVFVSVVDWGPYAWVRHPMTFIELLMAVVFAVEFPSIWNAAVLIFVLQAKLCITLWEEKFLLSEASYRDYAERVRWRWLPGVW